MQNVIAHVGRDTPSPLAVFAFVRLDRAQAMGLMTKLASDLIALDKRHKPALDETSVDFVDIGNGATCAVGGSGVLGTKDLIDAGLKLLGYDGLVVGVGNQKVVQEKATASDFFLAQAVFAE